MFLIILLIYGHTLYGMFLIILYNIFDILFMITNSVEVHF